MSVSPDRSEVRDLFPELTDKELEEAEANLRAYFQIAHDVCATIDNGQRRSTMEERSKVNLKI